MDYPYIILLFLLLFLSYQEWKHPQYSNSLFRCACWIVFIFIAFRAPVVGADTWDYYRYATGIRNFYNADSRELEPLYQLYNNLFRKYCPIGDCIHVSEYNHYICTNSIYTKKVLQI